MAIWYTYRSYRLTVIHDYGLLSEFDKVIVQGENVKSREISKLPVVLYVVVMSGLWMLLLAGLDMWSK